MSKRKGFTLIELLVVIAIIALLMSILMPALSRVKAQAQDVLCKNNLHSWGLIWKIFTDENRGLFPDNRGDVQHYPVTLLLYNNSLYNPEIFLCPTTTKTWVDGGRNPFRAHGLPSRPSDPEYEGLIYDDELIGSYTINTWLANSGGREFDYWKTPNIMGARHVPVMCDGMTTEFQPYSTDEPSVLESTFSHPGQFNELPRVAVKRHARYHINVVFLDFTVRRITIKQIWQTRWSLGWVENPQPLPVWPVWMDDCPDP